MSSGGHSLDGSGKQPFASISSVFSGLFSRDRSATADGPALLTAFRGVPEAEDPLPDTGESKREKGGEPHSSNAGKRNDATEPELVQVTRVETYSDTENEADGQGSPHSCRRPKGDEDEPRCESESECEVPAFRTHTFDRPCIENMLDAENSRWKNRCRTVGADAPSPESNSVSEGMETPNSGSNRKVGTAESGECVGIDCSFPLPSIISGPTGLGAAGQDAAADLHGTDKAEMKEGSAASPEGPETPGVSDGSASSPNEPPVDPSTPVGGHQPALQHTDTPKTPERSTPPSDLSVPSSRSATPSSPPSFQMPALFSGFRVLKKGAVGEERDTTAEIKQREKDADLALLSLKKSVNKAKLYPEQKTPSPSSKEPAGGKTAATGQPTNTSDGRQGADINGQKVSANGEDGRAEKSTGTPEKRTTSDLAYETFRSIFGTRGASKDTTEDEDLEALKRKLKGDKENLKSIFERVSRTLSKELKSPTETQVRFTPL